MKNKIILVFVTILLLFSLALPCFALSHSTYNDLSQNSSNVQNLLSFAMNYNSFRDSKYVVYCSSQYTYFIVWGDLSVSQNKIISNTEVHFVEYSRGTDMQYSYTKSVSDNFSLTVNDVVVTNLEGIGMASQTFEDFEYRNNFSDFSILAIVILFFTLLLIIRKG